MYGSQQRIPIAVIPTTMNKRPSSKLILSVSEITLSDNLSIVGYNTSPIGKYSRL